MLYFVDEDKNELEPYVFELEGRGYQCKILRNADDAYDVLLTANDIELAVIDVMLATANAQTSRFAAVDTDNFVTTGLTLLDHLVENQGAERSSIFPSRAIFFSSARIGAVVSKIKHKAERHNVRYLDKNEFSSTPEFANAITDVLGALE